jgi:hypothetical protein
VADELFEDLLDVSDVAGSGVCLGVECPTPTRGLTVFASPAFCHCHVDALSMLDLCTISCFSGKVFALIEARREKLLASMGGKQPLAILRACNGVQPSSLPHGPFL